MRLLASARAKPGTRPLLILALCCFSLNRHNQYTPPLWEQLRMDPEQTDSLQSLPPSQEPGRLSRRSYRSFLSLGSAASILSIGSAGSILSIGSAGSILSIGSAGSILSIGSTASILSVLSKGSTLSVLCAGSILSVLRFQAMHNRQSLRFPFRRHLFPGIH